VLLEFTYRSLLPRGSVATFVVVFFLLPPPPYRIANRVLFQVSPGLKANSPFDREPLPLVSLWLVVHFEPLLPAATDGQQRWGPKSYGNAGLFFFMLFVCYGTISTLHDINIWWPHESHCWTPISF